MNAFAQIKAIYHVLALAPFAVVVFICGAAWALKVDRGKLTTYSTVLLQPLNRVIGTRIYAVALIAVAVLIPYAFALRLNYIPQHDSAETFGLSWLLYSGAPLYHDFLAAQRWAPIYGPLPFIVTGALMRVFGPGALAMHAVSLALYLMIFGLLWRALRDRRVFGWLLTALWIFGTVFEHVYADTYIYLIVAGFAALLAYREQLPAMALGLGVALLGGLLANVKIHAPLYLLPMYFAVVPRRLLAPGALGLQLGLALVVALAPFAVPGISLTNYIGWLRTYSHQGLDPTLLIYDLNFAALILCALFVALRHADPGGTVGGRRRLVTLVAAACLFATAFVSAKPGAGPHHLVPYFIDVAFLACLARRNPVRDGTAANFTTIGAAVILACTVFIDAQPAVDFLRNYAQFLATKPSARVNEIEKFLSSVAPRPVLIAPGDRSDEDSWLTTLPAYRGTAFLTVDFVLMDMEAAGAPIPAATVAAIASCKYAYVLSPKGEQPFGLRSYYSGARPLYSDAFVSAFNRTYRHVQTLQYDDVWACGEK